jgi:MFS family permease
VGIWFSRDQLSLPMIIYTSSLFLGPELGPVIGGFINYYTNWQWTFWVLQIWAGVQWLMITIFVPETYHPVLLRNEAQRLRRDTGEPKWDVPIAKMDRSIAQTVIRSCYRPFMPLALEPMCLLLCIYTSLLLGVFYLFSGASTLVFANNHDFNLWQVGLSFLGMLVGMLCC